MKPIPGEGEFFFPLLPSTTKSRDRPGSCWLTISHLAQVSCFTFNTNPTDNFIIKEGKFGQIGFFGMKEPGPGSQWRLAYLGVAIMWYFFLLVLYHRLIRIDGLYNYCHGTYLISWYQTIKSLTPQGIINVNVIHFARVFVCLTFLLFDPWQMYDVSGCMVSLILTGIEKSNPNTLTII